MKKKNYKDLHVSLFMLTAFILWTIAVSFVDVKAIGPEGSSVGFATVNSAVRNFIGVHMSLYHMVKLLKVMHLCLG